MDGVCGNADIGVDVIGQHRVATVGVAGAAREIAAGHVDLDAATGAESVVDVAEIDGQPLDLTRPGARRASARRAGKFFRD
jgi:hypothetical protein